MNTLEAVSILVECKPIYQKLLSIRQYSPTRDEKDCLVKLSQIYEAGLADDPEVLEAAGLDLYGIGLLIGYLFTPKDDAPPDSDAAA